MHRPIAARATSAYRHVGTSASRSSEAGSVRNVVSHPRATYSARELPPCERDLRRDMGCDG